MQIVWSPQAKDDLFALYEYVSEENREAAKKVLTHIRSKVELLAHTPGIGRPGRVPGTRELWIDKTPFLVPYRVAHGKLEILRVYHSSRKWPVKFD